MTLLALDLGTTTGWACRDKHNITLSGIWDLRGGRFEGGGMRFVRFKSMLEQMHRMHPVTRIAYEEVRRHAATDAAHVYGGLMATLTSWCEGEKIPYEAIPVGTIKKHATGKGNANKAAMIEAVKAKGFSPKDDNEADAIALLLLVLSSTANAA
jgi:Holliday junction resolvasome RuvABC endonuclease subunit